MTTECNPVFFCSSVQSSSFHLSLQQKVKETGNVLFFHSKYASAFQGTDFSYFSKRAVTEHQLLNDRGRTLQGLKRLMWLHNAMGGVHTASGRDLSQAHALLTSKEHDFSDLYDTMDREEMSDMMEPLLLELLGRDTSFTKIPKANLLYYLKNGKGHQLLQDLSDLFQMGSQDGK